MRKADSIVRLLLADIEGKMVLEAACGSAELGYAREVHCVDMVDSMFDTVVIYNALAHIREQWEAIRAECMRVLRLGGKLCVVGTWKLDTALMEDVFGDAVRTNGECSVVELCKAC